MYFFKLQQIISIGISLEREQNVKKNAKMYFLYFSILPKHKYIRLVALGYGNVLLRKGRKSQKDFCYINNALFF